jgi:2-C-methyl-D-erythritol 4-phosphate cytidylyltransferase / 2-C-methyl-D-erythritol 2,4-cyclodiphosphate synthase
MTIHTSEHNVISQTTEAKRSTMTTIAALIVAAGRGTRAATAGLPKQYVTLNGLSILAHTLRPFLAHHLVTSVKVVVNAADKHLYETAVAALGPQNKLLPAAIGSDPRQASVKQGLDAFGNNPPDFVLIHDAARPFISLEMISNSLDALKTSAAAILASRLTDTVKRCTSTYLVAETIPRDDLWRAETPQAFRYRDILDAHRKALDAGQRDFTDDAGLAEWAGIPVTVVDSGGGNTKITTSEDLVIASARLAARSATKE